MVASRAKRLVFALALLCGCSSGPPVRDAVQVVLHEIADGWKHRDAKEATAAYDPSFRVLDPFARATEESREVHAIKSTRANGELDLGAYRALVARQLDGFLAVDKAKFILESIDDRGDEVVCEVTFRLYGTLSDGSLHNEIDRQRVVFRRGDDGKLCVREHVTLDRESQEGNGDQFVDRSKEARLAFKHEPHVKIDKVNSPVIPGNYLGSGASAGDIDGDGWLDLVVGDGVKTRVLHNRGDGTFDDITDTCGIGTVGAVRGAYFFDYDDDGRLDIFLVRALQPPKLFRNVDGLHFIDVSDKALPRFEPGDGTSAAIADLDGDGFLDIYLVNYGDFSKTGWAWPIWNATNGQKNVVLRNKGDGTFALVDDPVLTPIGWGLAAAIADYDDCGRPSIYVANDYGLGHLFHNDGGWKFTEVTEQAGVVDRGYGMGVAWGDWDGSGRLGLYKTNMFSSSRWAFQDPNFPLPLIADILMLRGQVGKDMLQVTKGNTLFKNNGDGTFTDVTQATNTERADWAWGADFVDYDNDGLLDIYCPNGFISGTDPADQ